MLRHGKNLSPARASLSRRPAPEVGRGKKKVDRGPNEPICFPVRFRKELQRMELLPTRKSARTPRWIRFLRGGIGATDPKGA